MLNNPLRVEPHVGKQAKTKACEEANTIHTDFYAVPLVLAPYPEKAARGPIQTSLGKILEIRHRLGESRNYLKIL